MDRRIAAARADARPAPRRPRPPLSARRGDQVRRLHRRLVEAVEAHQPAPGRRVHHLLRRPLHGRERGHPGRAAPAGDPARPGRRLLDGRHGRARAARDGVEGSRSRRRRLDGDPRHLHQLRGQHQSVRRRARRRRLHVRQRQGDARVGVGPRREDHLPARSAPRPQHRLQDGRAARRDAGVGSARAVRRPRRRDDQEGAHAAVEGPLLGPHALHASARSRTCGSSTRRPR